MVLIFQARKNLPKTEITRVDVILSQRQSQQNLNKTVSFHLKTEFLVQIFNSSVRCVVQT